MSSGRRGFQKTGRRETRKLLARPGRRGQRRDTHSKSTDCGGIGFCFMTTPRLRTPFKNFIRTNDSFEEVFGGCYECDLIDAPKTVLDVGANEGAFTAWALGKWTDCTVTAFEPVPENAEIFTKNHGGSRVQFHRKAVSNSPTLDIHLGDDNSGDCSAYNIGNQLPEHIRVECIAPWAIASAEFVKVDTEGCEVEIISGLDLSKTAALVCEYHRDEDCHKIISLVEHAD